MRSNDGHSFDQLLLDGTRHLQAGRPQKALPLLHRAIELRPDDIDAVLNFSGALILNRKFKDAVRLLEETVEREPSNVMVWINLGAAYLGNPVLAGEDEQLKAIEAFTQAMELDVWAPSVAYNMGLIYRDRGQMEEAIRWFERAIEANPEDRDARNILRCLKVNN